MNIRRAQQKDANQIYRILKTTIELQGMGKESVIYTKFFVKSVIKNKKANTVLVAEEKNKILGFIIAENFRSEKYSFLTDIAIIKKARRRGIGKKLFTAYIKYCKKNRMNAIATSVKVTNKNMQNFCKQVNLIRGEKFFYYEKKL